MKLLFVHDATSLISPQRLFGTRYCRRRGVALSAPAQRPPNVPLFGAPYSLTHASRTHDWPTSTGAASGTLHSPGRATTAFDTRCSEIFAPFEPSADTSQPATSAVAGRACRSMSSTKNESHPPESSTANLSVLLSDVCHLSDCIASLQSATAGEVENDRLYLPFGVYSQCSHQ